MQAVTPVPQEVKTGRSNEMPAEEYIIRRHNFARTIKKCQN